MKMELFGGIDISHKRCSIVLIDYSETQVFQTQISPYREAIGKALQPYATNISGLAICGADAHSGLAEHLIDSGYKTYFISRSKLSGKPEQIDDRAFNAAGLLRRTMANQLGNVKQRKTNLTKLLGKSVLSDLYKLPITTFLTRL